MNTSLTVQDNKLRKQELVKFYLPAFFEQFVTKISVLAGAAFLGHVGTIELSASSLSATLISIPEALILGYAIAVTAKSAKFHNDEAELRKTASCGFFVTLILSVILMFSLFAFSKNLVNLMFSSSEAAVKTSTNTYFRIMLFALPFYALDFTSSAMMRAVGDSKTPFRIMIGANCINLLFIYLCLYVWHFDYRSAAVCYVMSFVLSGCVKFFLILSGKYRFTMRFARFSAARFKEIAKLGVPCMFERFLVQVAFLGLQTITALLGTITLAGYSAANNVLSFTYTFALGLEVTLVSLVGRYKYEDKKVAEFFVKYAYKLGFLTTCVFGVILFVFAEGFVSIFAKDEEVIKSAAEILRYMAFTIPITTAFQVGMGALKTGTDVNYVLGVTIIAPNFVRVPVAYLLVSVYHMGFLGLYIGCATDYLIRAVIVLWRIKRKSWLE